jgi:hypothetical protein
MLACKIPHARANSSVISVLLHSLYIGTVQSSNPDHCACLQGSMFPAYHKFYWMGLKYNEELSLQGERVYRWIDQLIPGPSRYKHWSLTVLQDGNVLQEPNNIAGNEDCGGGNVTQQFGSPVAYGWGDESCDKRFAFMCRWGGRAGTVAVTERSHAWCWETFAPVSLQPPHICMLTLRASLHATIPV